MTQKKVTLSAVAVAVFMLLFPYLVCAHSLWVNVTEHAPALHKDSTAKTKTYLGYGHHYPVDDFLSPSSVREYAVIDPMGRRAPVASHTGSGFLESELTLKGEGCHVVAVATKPGFYTMYSKGDEIHHRLGPKTGLDGVILSYYYEQYAKSLVFVGNGDGKGYRNEAGHRLEIIPMDNPMKLKGDGGHILRVKVFFNGKPARYSRVYATYSGFSTDDDFAFASTADKEGIAGIRLTHWGRWLVKANVKVPASGDVKDKCTEENYTATLTFEVP